jgi:hypothetical protein
VRISTAFSVLVVAACSSAPSSTTANEPTAAAPKSDTALFPAAWPAFKNLDQATDATRIVELAREARSQLDEEYELSTRTPARDAAYKRLTVRVRIAQNHALVATGHSLEALADLAKQPFDCPAQPQRTRETCDALMAGLVTAFPNIVSGPGKIAQVDHSLLVDEAMTETALATFMQKAADSHGSVVQRMRLTSATGGVAKVGTALQLRVPAKQKLGGGDVVWVAFEPRKAKHVGKTWDLAGAHVLFVESE